MIAESVIDSSIKALDYLAVLGMEEHHHCDATVHSTVDRLLSDPTSGSQQSSLDFTPPTHQSSTPFLEQDKIDGPFTNLYIIQRGFIRACCSLSNKARFDSEQQRIFTHLLSRDEEE